jgi:hypothetical protein
MLSLIAVGELARSSELGLCLVEQQAISAIGE